MNKRLRNHDDMARVCDELAWARKRGKESHFMFKERKFLWSNRFIEKGDEFNLGTVISRKARRNPFC